MSEKTSRIEHKADESLPQVSIDDADPIDLSQMPVAGPSHMPDAELLQQPAGDASNEESVARVFKLDCCIDQLFEYLSLKDLFVLRQTCKRFKRLVDYHIKEYYPAIKLNYLKISVDWETKIDQFRFLDSNLIKSIKAIDLGDIRIRDAKTLKGILNNVEVVEVQNSDKRQYFHEVLLKFCSKIKYFKIYAIETDVDFDISWLEQQYPTLEHIALDDEYMGDYNGVKIPKLRTFFTINPNIRCFSTSLCLLWNNRDWLLGSDIKLDQLEVDNVNVDEDGFYENKIRLVENLYAEGFYQRLHYYAREEDDDHMSLINSVPGLEKLFLVNFSKSTRDAIDLVVPPSLKELCLGSSNDILNPEVVANNLLNVERISIGRTSVDGILPYVRFSPRLKEIRVRELVDEILIDDIIDLVKLLNQERQELRGAKKLRLYLNEDIFLKIKWSGFATKRSLIEIKRHEEFPRQPYSAFHSSYYNFD